MKREYYNCKIHFIDKLDIERELDKWRFKDLPEVSKYVKENYPDHEGYTIQTVWRESRP